MKKRIVLRKIKTFKKHPVKAGKVEEVGEGEGGTEQGGSQVWRHLFLDIIVSLESTTDRVRI